ncbi:phosphatidylethanolamine N-methyltransferase [Cordyceps fumosorosea ARSEF 2679]|uniref:Phosphatidyl-N-methylethanolamine N-methyltransferase n=1 Tax=Cordyceps fumosorosea (strain ARSEF 2679) TaxID=1081104 RepID=A0A167SCU9_CORFA|nr:phosphatidylethanolamine N-methyltransferase [Cordyceps fumosorosea ARSEF 2679]OAA59498.1 phosphatidylethanolamine N-methyltransferase [Cordyceps fumosorosea ARSEF 2679]
MASSLVGQLASYVDFDKQSLRISAASIIFNPLFWNSDKEGGRGKWLIQSHIFAEYRNQVLSKLFGGNRTLANYALAATIFSIGIIRDWLYKTAILEQPTHPALQGLPTQAAAYTLLAAGNVLVVTSTWRLGIRGTFLGDYFGFLQEKMVTGFPFNVTGAPMYWGSTMSFLGTALLFGRPAGVVLTALVYVVYVVALRFEDPFTAGIYAKRDRDRAAAKAGKKSN